MDTYPGPFIPWLPKEAYTLSSCTVEGLVERRQGSFWETICYPTVQVRIWGVLKETMNVQFVLMILMMVMLLFMNAGFPVGLAPC